MAPWLKCDRVDRWKKGRFQVRLERYGKRINVLPGIHLNWEEGMFTVWLSWINLSLGFDYEFDPSWDPSEAIEYPVPRDQVNQ